MGKNDFSFTRKAARYKPQPKVLVLCEDSKSCLSYLQDASRHFRAHADVEIAHCDRTDPLGIVKEAIRRKSKYDEIYCAIDRDSHQRFDEALQLAQAHPDKIDVVVSYPCYEYWLLLHFKRTRKPYVATGAKSACEMLLVELQQEPEMQKYAKGSSANLFAVLKDRLANAIGRAEGVLAEAQQDQALNPSTRIHQLIQMLDNLGKVKAAE